jgi:hypothetical protein
LRDQFEAAGYEHYIDQGKPQPALVEADLSWTEELLKTKGG